MSILYAVASLPGLVLEEAPPTTARHFYEQMTGVLRESDRAELGLLVEGRPEEGTSDFSRQWSSLETQLRNHVARVRGKRIGVDAGPTLRRHDFFDSRIEPIVVDAFAKSTPLERERVLDEGRWALLEDLVSRDAYGLSAVLAYAVKLTIAARWAGLDKNRGRRELDGALQQVLESADEADV